ncbi:MmgE/PrpD family protein [Rhizobium sp. 2MFCol3.1]|uniref:MmgE/PrpD family protein n=1 Tax=Rhizobium sp. 2MFCol3.1 TaxID=1246459 RepID=UPI0003A98007|nr:MmgE/PrpD family protein [Rhizobium sp. 2MFCol3.1]
MFIAHLLGKHIADVARQGPPPETSDTVLHLVLDVVAAGAAGGICDGPRAVRRSALSVFGSGDAPIWFCGTGSSATGAVHCNVAACCALDVDDGHRAARGHPGAAVVATALALAQLHDRPTDRFLAAIVAGYDVGVRIAAAQNPVGIATRQSGRWASLASAATAAAFLGHQPGVIAHALSIAGVLAPNQQANGSSGYSSLTGNDVKEGIAWSSATGLMALELASHGHTGPEDFLDHPNFYDGERILSDLGSRWEVNGLYLKPYACCRYIHPALDRLCDLIDQHDIVAEEVRLVEVETFAWATKLGNRTNPDNLIEVQYSLPYCLAVALVDGPQALLPPRRDCLGRPDIESVAKKVKILVRDDIDALFPSETLAVVRVETSTTRVTSEIGTPFGDPRYPMLWSDVEKKLRVLTRDVLAAQQQGEIIDAVLSLASGEISPLLSALKSTFPALDAQQNL